MGNNPIISQFFKNSLGERTEKVSTNLLKTKGANVREG